MFFEYLDPVNKKLIEQVKLLSNACLGNKIVFHSEDEFPDLKKVRLALIGVLDNRGDKNQSELESLDHFRSTFYSFYPGNWEFSMADLGDLKAGETQEDTYFAVNKIITELIKKGILPIILGGTQDLTYPIYRAYDNLEQMVNLVTIDSKFDLGTQNNENSNDSYLSKILTNEPHNLGNYSNIGYQTYFNSQEEIDLLEKMYFDIYRLGEIIEDISLAEPVLRDADFVSLDINAVKYSATGNLKNFQPNGFDGVEVCKLARYTGISDKVTSFGIFNLTNTKNEAVLLSEIIWYFIEGYHYRSNEYPFKSKSTYSKYYVPIDDIELLFYKSETTGRWWIDLNQSASQNKTGNGTLISCTENDYLRACDQEIPERWWRAQRKQMI